MKIYILTSVGDATSSNPNSSGSDAMRVLYWLRRHGKQGTDEQMKGQLNISGSDLRTALTELEHNQMVRCVVSA